jgi:lysozyme
MDGIDLIKESEGCRLQSYKCPAGVWTIGWGTTKYEDGSKVSKNDEITQDKADGLLYSEISRIRQSEKFKAMVLTDLSETAVCSLIYNVGEGSFYKSSLYKAICNRDYLNIMHNWDWIKAGGNVLLGLAKRRASELAIFMEGIK